MPMRYYAPFPGGGGDPAWPRGPHTMRIGDAERDVAAADLGDHYAAGRLTLDELHERLDAVFTARTFGQLTRLMSDLPGTRRPAWNGKPGVAAPAVQRAEPWFFDFGREPTGLRDEGHLGTAGHPWHVIDSPDADFRSGDVREPTPTDRAGRFAALSLLLLAMLIWLFTALLFARHGFYHTGPVVIPPGSVSHFYPPGGGG